MSIVVNNLITLLVLIVFFIYIFSLLKGKSMMETYNDIKQFLEDQNDKLR